jgi:serine O-acetyltransferase
MSALRLYRFGNWCYRRQIPFLPTLARNLIYLVANSYVPSSASIGEGSIFGYGGMGVVIHANAVIGNHCVIGHGVTIGSAVGYSSAKVMPCPTIGDNCFMGAGAKILGGIRVGNNCVIGAGALVLKDVADGSIVAGMPAKVIGAVDADYKAIRR